MCFSDREPGDWGPRRFREDELRAEFGDGWTTESLTAETFDLDRSTASPRFTPGSR
jgi:hypothetical protein